MVRLTSGGHKENTVGEPANGDIVCRAARKNLRLWNFYYLRNSGKFLWRVMLLFSCKQQLQFPTFPARFGFRFIFL